MSVELINIDPDEYLITAVRSSGPGGQHANKVATAILLKYDITTSSLSDRIKENLLNLSDSRITKEGTIVIQVSTSRSQDDNRKEAIKRLQAMIQEAAKEKKKRRETKPTKESKEKRRILKAQKSEKKERRKKPLLED